MQTWSPRDVVGKQAEAGVVDFSAFSATHGTFEQALIQNLVQPVRIHLPIRNQTQKATCVWYDLNMNSSTMWNTEGCQLREVTSTAVVCECFHLTRFGAFLWSETKRMPFEHIRSFKLGMFDGPIAAAFILGFCTMHTFGAVLHFMDLRDEHRGRIKAHHAHKAAMLDAILSGNAFHKQTLKFTFKSRHPLARVFYYGTSSSLGRYQLWDVTSTSLAFSMLWSVLPGVCLSSICFAFVLHVDVFVCVGRLQQTVVTWAVCMAHNHLLRRHIYCDAGDGYPFAQGRCQSQAFDPC